MAGNSNQGKERGNNEDRYVIVESGADGLGAVLCVADGMGGHPAGERASELIAEALETYGQELHRTAELAKSLRADNKMAQDSMRAKRIDEIARRLEEAIANAHESILELGARDPDKSGLGSTVVALQLLGDAVRVLHCGDSRAYLLRAESLLQLSSDHVVVENGTRYLSAHVGLNYGLSLEIDELIVEPGDRLLVCSDGLTDMVPPEVFGMALHEAPTPEQAVESLIEMANLAGGHDNITCVVGFIG